MVKRYRFRGISYFGSAGGFSSFSVLGSYPVKLTVTSKDIPDTVYRTIRVIAEQSSESKSPDPKVTQQLV